MENIDNSRKKIQPNRGSLLVGLLLLIIGGVLVARQFDFYFPYWLFRWEMLLIVIGLFIGARQSFRNMGWLILVGIGAIFLADDIWPALPIMNFSWPIIIIAIGLALILGAFRRKSKSGSENDSSVLHPVPAQQTSTGQDVLDVAAIFGGSKNVIFSKNFKGGEIVCVFGGSEVNLMQADFTGKIKIEIVQIFGGTKLIVPANWQIHAETAAILGGVEDKRSPENVTDPQKIVILEGTAMFGGIEITSY